MTKFWQSFKSSWKDRDAVVHHLTEEHNIREFEFYWHLPLLSSGATIPPPHRRDDIQGRGIATVMHDSYQKLFEGRKDTNQAKTSSHWRSICCSTLTRTNFISFVDNKTHVGGVIKIINNSKLLEQNPASLAIKLRIRTERCHKKQG